MYQMAGYQLHEVKLAEANTENTVETTESAGKAKDTLLTPSGITR